ncbi:MAG TPA: hypothetical protein VJI12_02070 [archaeon]|nr:hypothetical protein [archaeon]
MKGQYRIVSELILFGMGILITSYVVINFNNVQDNLQGITAYDQMNAVADSVSNAIVKASSTENSTIDIRVPDKISGSSYRIALWSDNGGQIVLSTTDGKAMVKRQLFNINYDNIIGSNSVINDSEILSTAEFVRVIKNSKITIVRA